MPRRRGSRRGWDFIDPFFESINAHVWKPHFFLVFSFFFFFKLRWIRKILLSVWRSRFIRTIRQKSQQPWSYAGNCANSGFQPQWCSNQASALFGGIGMFLIIKNQAYCKKTQYPGITGNILHVAGLAHRFFRSHRKWWLFSGPRVVSVGQNRDHDGLVNAV